MSNRDATSLARQADPIRIVPLQLADDVAAPAAGPAAPPDLTYRGGPLLASVKVFTVFWGTEWTQAPLTGLVDQINGFFDFVLTSALIDQLAEYNVANYQIGHGSRIGSATVTSPAVRRVAPDGAIQHLLRQETTTNGAFPQPDANTLFFVYLQPGVVAVQGGSRSCSSFCGYHNNVGSQLFYAVMPYPGCNGCTGNLQPFDALTSTSSHELAEAITDAIPGEGWYDDQNGEIGDICAWKTKQLGNYTVQLLWSNHAGGCV
jgi:hypothetical protein